MTEKEDRQNQFDNLFFGYVYWDSETQSLVDFQVYSLDLSSNEWELTPEDIKHIQDYIIAEAPSIMEE